MCSQCLLSMSHVDCDFNDFGGYGFPDDAVCGMPENVVPLAQA